MLRFARALYLAACDPDYPDRHLAAGLQARAGEGANRMEALYQARRDEVLQRNPNLSRGTLQSSG